MGFLFFLILLFVGYIIIRYRETTFPLIKKVFGDIQSDIDKVRTKVASTNDLPYEPKEYFFSKSELEFFRILNSHLDAHRHTIFPKVRLADLVQIVGGKWKNVGAWNSVKSKHIDYLIWDLVDSKVVMAIELDGKSHNGQSAQKNDDFKNQLHEKIGLPLVRVQVGTDFETEARNIASRLY